MHPNTVPPGGAMENKIRVMVVDDSVVARGFISRAIESDPTIEIVASAQNGQVAVAMAARQLPDIVILDIEMPVMDGLTALPLIRNAAPNAIVLITSSLSARNAEIGMEALARGAADFIAKPGVHQIGRDTAYQRELLEKVLTLGANARHALPAAPPPVPLPDAAVPGTPVPVHAPAPAPIQPVARSLYPGHKVVLRKRVPVRPRILVVGSSTGGPPALAKLFEGLARGFEAPVLIAQHMPPAFTTVLAEHVGRAAMRPAAEAVEGEAILPGHIYVAPGDWHLELAGSSENPTAHLTQAPPENYCRPSVNPLFRSAARLYGAAAGAVILTGMGCDGLEGARLLADAGAALIAQDEASSVVWGMPGAVATQGLCTAVLPLDNIAHAVLNLFAEGKP
jgi:two-component system, chemotaxis family, protein-glutamate methylesterase/glutaminase